jgi:hypothetical protein
MLELKRNPRAQALLEAQLKQRGDLKRVADLLKVSHTYLSLYRSGAIRSANALEARILAEFERFVCPHDGEEKRADVCQKTGLRPRPHGWHEADAAWLACQTCPRLEVLKTLSACAQKQACKTSKTTVTQPKQKPVRRKS